MMAPPVTYTVGGEQYVAIVAGFGGGALWGGDAGVAASSFHENVGRVLAWKLGADEPVPAVGEAAGDSRAAAPHGVRRRGDRGPRALPQVLRRLSRLERVGNRVLPDLKYSIAEISGQFEEIVIGGSMA